MKNLVISIVVVNSNWPWLDPEFTHLAECLDCGVDCVFDYINQPWVGLVSNRDIFGIRTILALVDELKTTSTQGVIVDDFGKKISRRAEFRAQSGKS